MPNLTATRHNLTLTYNPTYSVGRPFGIRADKVPNPMTNWFDGYTDTGTLLPALREQWPSALGAFMRYLPGGLVFQSSADPETLWTFVTNSDLTVLFNDIADQIEASKRDSLMPAGVYSVQASPRYKPNMSRDAFTAAWKDSKQPYVWLHTSPTTTKCFMAGGGYDNDGVIKGIGDLISVAHWRKSYSLISVSE